MIGIRGRYLDEKDIENIKESLIQILQNTKEKPVSLGADESPQGVYNEVISGINRYSESIENNPLALVFTKDNVGYIRTNFQRNCKWDIPEKRYWGC